jgi:phage/plasmid primase-like uncharacterized protein
MIFEKMEITATLTKIQCGECSGIYALSDRYVQQKREKGGYWNCPYCRCGWGYSKEDSELEKAKQQAKKYSNWLAREQANHDQTKMSLRAHKAAKTRIKNRVAQGICPCCKRYFANLHRHMENEHPDFSKESE